jgi:hypothetical protein
VNESRAREKSATSIALASRDVFVRPLARAEIEIAWCAEDAVLLGAFQRACDGPPEAIVRGTGGCAVRVGRGTLHVLVALPRIDHDESVILNRQVRPLLRALRGRYFGRDWIDVEHRPVAHVGFAHERATGRTVFEAFVAVRTPFIVSPRASYMGKTPATLEELRGSVDDDALLQSILDGYGFPAASNATSSKPTAHSSQPWGACVDEAIGPLCAGPDETGRLRVGGEFMASFDAVRDLEDRVAAGEPIREAVDAAFTAPHTALFGVRSLDSFARALEAARLRACAENP